MHLQHQPTCTTHHWAKPRMLVVFILGPEAQGKPGHRGPGWEDGQSGYGGGGYPVLCSCPRPQAPAEAKAQAGRHYLGLRQGLTLPGGFFAGIARGEGKGK